MKKWLSALLAMMLFLSVWVGFAHAQEEADAVLYGTIYTANEAGDFAEAVVVKDGRYIYVGDREGAKQYIGKETKTIEGAFIMPSGVESHAHYILEEVFKQGLYIDYYDAAGNMKPIEEMVLEIVAFREKHPDCSGIYGYGWNKITVAAMGTAVCREQIDAYIDDIPVYISGRDLHSGWCNTKCLEMAGVLKEECAVQGVERDETGTATGFIKDEACSYVRNMVFGEIEGYDAAVLEAQAILHAKGYTMLLDPWSNFDGTAAMFDAVNRADQEGLLNMVVFESYCVNTYDNYDEAVATAADIMQKYGTEHTAAKYIKLFADGTEEACTAYMLAPYSNGVYGTKNWESESMNYVTEIANKAGLLVHVHAYGDGSARQVLDAYENSNAMNGQNYRNSIAHAPYITDDDMLRIKDMGIGICGAGNWAMSNGEDGDSVMIDLLGEERFRSFYFVDRFVKYGIKAGMSTDRPCADGFAEDIFDYIGVLTTGIDYRKGSDRKAKRDTWVSVEEAIKMMTINGAWSLDADAERGSIEVGKYADFIIADANPFETELSEIHNINVVNTYFEGKCVFELNAALK